MKHGILIPLLAASTALVAAQDWEQVVTVTKTRTHYYCPCDDSTDVWKPEWETWATWPTSKSKYYPPTTWTTSTTSSKTSTSSVSISATLTSTSSSTTTSSTTSKTTSTTSASTTSSTSSTSSTTTSSTTTTSTTRTTTPSTTTKTTTSTTSSTTTAATTASCSSGLAAARSAQIGASFTSSGVVPTLIPAINPALEVFVNYGAKAVNLGNQFATTETTNQPALSFNAEVNQNPDTTTYSYFLVDPDVPNPDSALRMNYLHWYVSGAKSICATTPATNQQTVALYQALTPLSTQQHRYTFLVYREPANYSPNLITPQTRAGFDVNAYAASGGLTLVGGNFLREAITNGVTSTTTTVSIPIVTP